MKNWTKKFFIIKVLPYLPVSWKSWYCVQVVVEGARRVCSQVGEVWVFMRVWFHWFSNPWPIFHCAAPLDCDNTDTVMYVRCQSIAGHDDIIFATNNDFFLHKQFWGENK